MPHSGHGTASGKALGSDKLSLGRAADEAILRTETGAVIAVNLPPSRSGQGVVWNPRVVAMREAQA